MTLMAILLVMLVKVLNSACQGIVIQIIIAEIVSYNLSHLLFPSSCISLSHVIIFPSLFLQILMTVLLDRVIMVGTAW